MNAKQLWESLSEQERDAIYCGDTSFRELFVNLTKKELSYLNAKLGLWIHGVDRNPEGYSP